MSVIAIEDLATVIWQKRKEALLKRAHCEPEN